MTFSIDLDEMNPLKNDSIIIQDNDDDDDDENHKNHSRYQKGKINPPKTYDKYVNPPRTTTSFVKQLINGGGGTLVYDSLSQDHSLHTNPTSSLLQPQFYPNHYFQQQRKENARAQKTNTNASLTSVTQTLSKSSISPTNNRYHSVSFILTALHIFLFVCVSDEFQRKNEFFYFRRPMMMVCVILIIKNQTKIH